MFFNVHKGKWHGSPVSVKFLRTYYYRLRLIFFYLTIIAFYILSFILSDQRYIIIFSSYIITKLTFQIIFLSLFEFISIIVISLFFKNWKRMWNKVCSSNKQCFVIRKFLAVKNLKITIYSLLFSFFDGKQKREMKIRILLFYYGNLCFTSTIIDKNNIL